MGPTPYPHFCKAPYVAVATQEVDAAVHAAHSFIVKLVMPLHFLAEHCGHAAHLVGHRNELSLDGAKRRRLTNVHVVSASGKLAKVYR